MFFGVFVTIKKIHKPDMICCKLEKSSTFKIKFCFQLSLPFRPIIMSNYNFFETIFPPFPLLKIILVVSHLLQKENNRKI